jgi:hypothetical protein
MSDRVLTATRMGFRDQLRRPLMLALLAAVPIIFISWAARVTAENPRRIALPGGAHALTDMRELMTVIDVPITIAFLSGLVGVFVIESALQSDRRLVVAGYSPGQTIAPRLLVIGAAVAVVSAVSLVVMAFEFIPEQWLSFIAANLLLGLIYAALGALSGTLMGRLGAVYLLFFLPNIDIGIAQDPLFFNGDPQGWATALPGYGPTRMIIDASYSSGFHTVGALLVSLAWVAVLGAALAVVLRRAVAPRR